MSADERLVEARVVSIRIYPIKSCQAVELDSAVIGATGFEFDRFFMVINDSNRFVTQRQHPKLCLVKPTFSDDYRFLTLSAPGMPELSFLIKEPNRPRVVAGIWRDKVEVECCGQEVGNWFTRYLDQKSEFRLVARPSIEEGYQRNANGEQGKDVFTYDVKQPQVSLADRSQYLLGSLDSIDKLNSLLPQQTNKLKINRFRPNIIIRGADAFDEDDWKKIQIGDDPTNTFSSFARCSRCKVTTIVQEQGEYDPTNEPANTLSRERRSEKGEFFFGQLMVAQATDYKKVRVGDTITVLERLSETEVPHDMKIFSTTANLQTISSPSVFELSM